MFRKTCRFYRSHSSVRRMSGEAVVDNDLTLTPSQMDELRRLGRPITAQHLPSLDYQDDNPRWMEPAPEHMRGADFGTLWELHRDIADKARIKREVNVELVEPQSVQS